MIVLSQIFILMILGYSAGSIVKQWYDERPIKYYTLESTDGYTYEMAYATRQLAIDDAKALAYSGTAYEHTVGGGKRLSFVW